MKGILTERNVVVILFVMVLITFSLAQNETSKIEHLYNGGQSAYIKSTSTKLEAKARIPQATKPILATE